MANSSIEWTDKVWNPVTGCTKVSQGCKHCYAEGIAGRFFAKQYPPNADGSPRKFTDVRCHEERLDAPLHWRKPARIFVNSMSDLFHPDVPVEFIDRVFAMMALSPQHTFQVLTKRPQRMREFFAGAGRGGGVFNAWLGVSVEDQATADARIPLLLQTPAAVRWISYEPALGPLDVQQALTYRRRDIPDGDDGGRFLAGIQGVDWVVCGGESGPHARPMHPDWARSMRDQCQAAGVPFFFKQWGEWLPAMCDGAPIDGQHLNASDEPVRVGKKAAGSLLDGIEHKQFPAPQTSAGAERG
jgi:protein gp37